MGSPEMSTWFRACRDDRGVSAVEFALILPVLVMLYLGCVEVSMAITADRKVTSAASVVGDLVAQAQNLCPADLNNIFDVTGKLLAPYDPSPLQLVVSHVEVTEDGNEVIWSEGLHATGRAKGSEITLPDDLAVEGEKLVVAEVEYLYQPTFGQTIKESITLSDTFYLRPRSPRGVNFKPNC